MGRHGRIALLAVVATVTCGAWATQASAHVYWANWNAPGYAVSRAATDGTQTVLPFVPGGNAPGDVAVDGTHVHWTNQLTSTIGRANLDGTGVDQSFIPDARTIAVAVDGAHVYWTNRVTDTIARANLDGSGVEVSFITGANAPRGVAVDGRHIFWSQINNDIARANRNGSGIDLSFIVGASDPEMLDVDNGYVYWANFGGAHSVGRAEIDGSGVDDTFIAGAGRPVGVAVDGGPWGSAEASVASMTIATAQPVGTIGPAVRLAIRNDGLGVLHIDSVHMASGQADEFLVSSDSCSHSALAPTATCEVRVRFAPTAVGARQAMLTVTSDDPTSPLQIPIHATGGPAAQGPHGAAGATGKTGATGPRGPAGTAGQVRMVTCKKAKVEVHGKRVTRLRCKTKLINGTATVKTRATLSRHGRVYATGTAHGTALRLHAHRRLHGRYTLTLRAGHEAVTHTRITVR